MRQKCFTAAGLMVLAGTLVLMVPSVGHAQRWFRRGIAIDAGPVGVYVGRGWDYGPYPYGYYRSNYDYDNYWGQNGYYSDRPYMNRESFYYAPTPNVPSPENADKAVVTVRVPAQAQLWIENAATQQKGSVREFISPALSPGQEYTYTVKAKWMQNGQDMESTRQVNVRAGADVRVDFLDHRQPAARPSMEAVPAPRENQRTQAGATNPRQSSPLKSSGQK